MHFMDYQIKRHNFVIIIKLMAWLIFIQRKNALIPECENEYEFVIDEQKYCLMHCPDKKYEIVLKRKCKYCDIEESSDYICKDCLKIQEPFGRSRISAQAKKTYGCKIYSQKYKYKI